MENATRSKVIQLLVSLHAFVSPRIILAYMRDTPMKLIPSPVTVVLKNINWKMKKMLQNIHLQEWIPRISYMPN